MGNKRVVVTGMGAVTPIGIGIDEYWSGLIKGKNGVGLITKFDADKFETKFAELFKVVEPLVQRVKAILFKCAVTLTATVLYRDKARAIQYFNML